MGCPKCKKIGDRKICDTVRLLRPRSGNMYSIMSRCTTCDVWLPKLPRCPCCGNLLRRARRSKTQRVNYLGNSAAPAAAQPISI